jgi:hypothetical protein
MAGGHPRFRIAAFQVPDGVFRNGGHGTTPEPAVFRNCTERPADLDSVNLYVIVLIGAGDRIRTYDRLITNHRFGLPVRFALLL